MWRSFRSLAEAGLTAKNLELAYAVSGAGLERGGPTEASFLVLRALSLPEYQEDRRAVCALAAAQLARQQRDMDVVEKAVELIAESPYDDLTFTPEQASSGAPARRKRNGRSPPHTAPAPTIAICWGQVCATVPNAAARAENPSDPFDFDDDDVDFDEDSDLDAILNATPLPPDMPPEIAKNAVRGNQEGRTARRVARLHAESGVRAGDGIRPEKQERQAQIMDPTEVLGVGQDAGEEEIRAAYVRKVKEHPPDRSPEEFERIRDAYDSLRDPAPAHARQAAFRGPVCAAGFRCRTEGPAAPLCRTAAVAGGAERKVTPGMSREEILRRFEKWLDSALAAEDPPRGVDAEILAALTGGDEAARPEPTATYSLWAAMTALTQEVKLQGRSFKELNDTLGSQQASRMAERERDVCSARPSGAAARKSWAC